MGKMRKSIFEIRDIYIRKIVHLKSSQIQSIAHILMVKEQPPRGLCAP